MTADLIAKLNAAGHAYWVDRNPLVTKWEGEFVSDMVKRYERFGKKTFVSEKQVAIINKIAAKLN
jgi:hypothetical protein